MKVLVVTFLSILLTTVLGQEASLRATRKLMDPKTVIEKRFEDGYVCSMGGEVWSNDQLLQHMGSFLEAWNDRNVFFKSNGASNINGGGNGLFHSFILWASLKNVKPSIVVESGVHQGMTSWLIEKATQEWKPTLVFIDPVSNGWDPTTASGRTVHDFRGEGKFKDFTELPWDSIHADRSNALVFFDDHMDQLRRLKEAHSLGFGHAMFDDNYVAGTGDMFSIKDACDRDGRVRSAFQRPGRPFQRCDMFHRECKELTPEMAEKAYVELDALADVIWEGPPLTMPQHPYSAIRGYIQAGIYEGPQEWSEQKHSQALVQSTKPPLFKDENEVKKLFDVNLRFEEGRYINVVYVKLKIGPVTLEKS